MALAAWPWTIDASIRFPAQGHQPTDDLHSCGVRNRAALAGCRLPRGAPTGTCKSASRTALGCDVGVVLCSPTRLAA